VRGYLRAIDSLTSHVSRGAQLRSIVAEVLSLERIHRTTETLNTDPVAAREFKDRWDAASLAEHDSVRELLDQPEQKRWFSNAKSSSGDLARQLYRSDSAVDLWLRR
jgi:hypothetical protein